jgi:hypothetical protein
MQDSSPTQEADEEKQTHESGAQYTIHTWAFVGISPVRSSQKAPSGRGSSPPSALGSSCCSSWSV